MYTKYFYDRFGAEFIVSVDPKTQHANFTVPHGLNFNWDYVRENVQVFDTHAGEYLVTVSICVDLANGTENLHVTVREIAERLEEHDEPRTEQSMEDYHNC